jgi:hypothetical protein
MKRALSTHLLITQRFSTYAVFVMLLWMSILNISCKKEYSYEGGIIPVAGGTAVYTLNGDGGNCTAPVINGSFTTGKALQASTIQLGVNVTTAGSYIISTGTNNGIEFSASGTFTATGPQTITLVGIGTPLATGTFPYTPKVGAGCTFFITVTDPVAQVATYTLGGDPGLCNTFKLNGNYIAGFNMTSDNTAEVSVNVTSPGSYSIKTDTLDGLSFSKSGTFTTTGIQKVTLQASGSGTVPQGLLFTTHGGTSSCAFPLTVLTPGPPATYVLESNQDHTCTGYSVTGNYLAGTPLLHTNNMAVKVTVTVLGNFTISTDMVNGMTFSFTGSFVTLGSQIVILTGYGTPVSTGTYTFTPQIVGPHPIGGETCTADVMVM